MASGATARLAGLVDQATRARTLGTRLRDAENSPGTDNLAPAVARATGAGFRSRLAAGPLAAVAALGFANGNFLLTAQRGFFEGNLEIILQERAVFMLPPPLPLPPPKTSRKMSNGS